MEVSSPTWHGLDAFKANHDEACTPAKGQVGGAAEWNEGETMDVEGR